MEIPDIRLNRKLLISVFLAGEISNRCVEVMRVGIENVGLYKFDRNKNGKEKLDKFVPFIHPEGWFSARCMEIRFFLLIFFFTRYTEKEVVRQSLRRLKNQLQRSDSN